MAHVFSHLIRPWLFSAALFVTPQLWGDTMLAYFDDRLVGPSDAFQEGSTPMR